MQLASINNVYTIVKNAANANQRGFVTPSQINAFALSVQQEVFQDIVGDYTLATANMQRYITQKQGEFNSIGELEDFLRPLMRFDEILTYASGKFTTPSTYAHYSAITYKNIDVTIISPSEFSFARNSFLAPPSDDMPIGVFESNGVTILPSTINADVKMSYYKFPQGSNPTTGASVTSNPTWGYNTIGDSVLYNPATSINFELPKILESRLASRILSYVGINLRETELVQFAEVQQKKENLNG